LEAQLPTPGEHLGDHEVLSKIAIGGMAAVYLARKRGSLGHRNLYALKVLLPELGQPEQIELFLAEARVTRSIHSPHVLQIFDSGESAGRAYIVMEYLRGHSFQAVMRQAYAKQTDVAQLVCAVLQQVCAGLAAAHAVGVMHRDIKPANIHVGDDGCVKLVDFGIAASRTLHGTLQYMAPELLLRSHAPDPRADVWSLGVVAWEALTGRYLFRGDDQASAKWNVLNKQVPDLRALVPSLPEGVAEQIMACITRDPLLRPELRDIEAALRTGARGLALATASTALFADAPAHDGLALPARPKRHDAGTSAVTRYFLARVQNLPRRPEAGWWATLAQRIAKVFTPR
jgi:serine/threonine-protein kinase